MRALKSEMKNANLSRWMLMECSQRFSYMQCSEPRDKIYVMMGIVHSSHIVTIDYDRPVQMVLLDVLHVFLESWNSNLTDGDLAETKSYIRDLDRIAVSRKLTWEDSCSFTDMLADMGGKGLLRPVTSSVTITQPKFPSIITGFGALSGGVYICGEPSHACEGQQGWWYKTEAKTSFSPTGHDGALLLKWCSSNSFNMLYSIPLVRHRFSAKFNNRRWFDGQADARPSFDIALHLISLPFCPI